MANQGGWEFVARDRVAVGVNVDMEVVPGGLFVFRETLELGRKIGAEFAPTPDETKFSYPRSSSTTRLFYVDLTK